MGRGGVEQVFVAAVLATDLIVRRLILERIIVFGIIAMVIFFFLSFSSELLVVAAFFISEALWVWSFFALKSVVTFVLVVERTYVVPKNDV